MDVRSIKYLKYSDDKVVQKTIVEAEKVPFDEAIKTFGFTGVYGIICGVNGMVYVGCTLALNQRRVCGIGQRLLKHKTTFNKKNT